MAKEFRSRGVFRALFDKGVEISKRDPNGLTMRLYVDKENESAMKVYEKFGMEKKEVVYKERSGGF